MGGGGFRPVPFEFPVPIHTSGGGGLGGGVRDLLERGGPGEGGRGSGGEGPPPSE